VMVVAGEVGRACAVIPWKSLGAEGCSVQLDSLELTFAPRPGGTANAAAAAAAESTASTAASTSCSDPAADAAPPSYAGADDGIRVIAMLVEKVLLRMSVTVTDLRLYVEGLPEQGAATPPGALVAPAMLLRAAELHVEADGTAASASVRAEGVRVEVGRQTLEEVPVVADSPPDATAVPLGAAAPALPPPPPMTTTTPVAAPWALVLGGDEAGGLGLGARARVQLETAAAAAHDVSRVSAPGECEYTLYETFHRRVSTGREKPSEIQGEN